MSFCNRGYVYDSESGLYYLQSRYYDPSIGRFLNADSFASTGQGVLGNNMFAYCRNNPVRRVDISGLADVDCYDNDPLDEEDILKSTQGGGPLQNVKVNLSGYGQAPKQGVPGSTYTQYSSDGKNSIVSETHYNEYGVRGKRIDYQGRDHKIGLPHVHEYSWAIRDGVLRPTGEQVHLYRMK